MGLRVLITRPEIDNTALGELLRARHIEPVSEPLMTIAATDTVPDFTGVQAVVLTSANGARALAGKCSPGDDGDIGDMPVFAVGGATAASAREAGFANVLSAAGDVAALAGLVIEKLDPAAGALLHPAGSEVAGDLAGALDAHGFRVRRAVLYEARASDRLSGAACRLLAGGDIDGALFFSPRTAQTFVILVNQAGLPAACRGIDAFCLSPAVGHALDGLSWRTLRMAREPETGALLDEVEAWKSQMNAEC